MRKDYTLHSADQLFDKITSDKNIDVNNSKNIPRKFIIQNILNYSKSLQIVKFKTLGNISLISN